MTTKPEYNGWVIFLIVIGVLIAENWVWLGFTVLLTVYVGWIQYLKLKQREQNGN